MPRRADNLKFSSLRSAQQQAGLDFVDGDLEKGLPLFVTPFAVSTGEDEWSAAPPESRGAAVDHLEGDDAVIAADVGSACLAARPLT